MEELFFGALSSIIGALVAFLGHRIIDLFYKNRSKEISVKFENGKTEFITVPSDATTEEISQAVQNLLTYENNILELLESELKKEHLSSIYENNNFDLIIKNLDKNYAIEIKNNFKAESLKQIEKYIENYKDIEKTFVISRSPISKHILDSAKDLVTSGKMQFLEISSPNDDQEKIYSLVHRIKSST